eukprot:5203733-Ditylum_brightwellii.AAC.1
MYKLVLEVPQNVAQYPKTPAMILCTRMDDDDDHEDNSDMMALCRANYDTDDEDGEDADKTDNVMTSDSQVRKIETKSIASKANEMH